MRKIELVEPLESMVTWLHTSKVVLASNLSYAIRFFSSEGLFHGIYGLGAVCFKVLCLCSVLCCLRTSSLHFADNRSGQTFQLCLILYVLHRRRKNSPDSAISGIKGS